MGEAGGGGRRVDLSSLVTRADKGSTRGTGREEGEGNTDVGFCAGVYLKHCYTVPNLLVTHTLAPTRWRRFPSNGETTKIPRVCSLPIFVVS